MIFGKTKNTNRMNLFIFIIHRGNHMGDTGARVMTHVLQMNRHLHTIHLDRNLLSLNNFEEIVNAMEE